ncbi:unnamed protein product [Lactuca saligna]|uniref:Uncharacterized protein n=1 Tax=Lactuca saligna TaxID=75948 RepID=A0AA35YFH9_LACSI|nr:unnamed protein product [Lactuca saligna]
MVIAPVWKRRGVRVAPSSNKETKSDDVGLHPRKVCRTVSKSRLLGSIGDVLGNKFLISDSTFGGALGSPVGSIQSKKPLADDRIGTAPSSSCSKAYAPGWPIIGKYGVQVVGDRRYAAAQASALMVAAANRVCRDGETKARLRPLCNTIVTMKEKL